MPAIWDFENAGAKMALIVKKFGGSSVADADCLRRVAGIIADTYSEGHRVVAVLSAPGKMTDELIKKANEINPKASKRELDMLLSTGEQTSIALCAMALEELGIPAVSLAGWQAGIRTSSQFGNARIRDISLERINAELDKNRVVLIAGFQGVTKTDDITTLGRGASDTTAVAVAAKLGASRCQIYSDVEGILTADPRIVPNAVKLDEITFDEMLELASLGAKVLHNRSVEIAKRYNVELEVLSSFVRKPGTIVREVTSMEETKISGVAKDNNIARIALIGLQDVPGTAFKVFRAMSKHHINVDIILQSIGRDNTKDITFTVSRNDKEAAIDALMEQQASIGFTTIDSSDKVSKVSIVGAGMINNPGIASSMFEALFDANINIHMISTSEIKVSVLIDEENTDAAMRAIHAKFFEV